MDTDYLIDVSSGMPSAVLTLHQLSSQGLAVSIVSYGEIFEGAYGFPEPQPVLAQYRQFLATYSLLLLTEPIMAIFAGMRASLRRLGSLIPDLDLLIGATAIHHDLTLVTRHEIPIRHAGQLQNGAGTIGDSSQRTQRQGGEWNGHETHVRMLDSWEYEHTVCPA